VKDENSVIIETVKLSKVFTDFWHRNRVKALDGVDLTVRRGEIFGLLGPNGSGKSTTIKILLGLLFPTRGRVSVFSRPPRNVDIKKKIGYLPEESYLYRYLNAEETLDFYGRLFRIPGRERMRRIDALLDMVGLSAQRKRLLVEYSKGMARRIGLAQAMINDPELLILDEPTNGLDPIGTREFKELLLYLRERGKTVLLCSHLLADVEDVCDRIAILYGGKVRAQGDVVDLLVKKEMTQLLTKQLSPATIEKIKGLIEEEEGACDVTVETPVERLERFFMNVVEKARADRLTTPGAEASGISVQDIFAQEKPVEDAAAILDRLMGKKEAKPPAPVVEEAEEKVEEEPKEEVKAREDVLKELLAAAREADRSAEEAEVEAPAYEPEKDAKEEKIELSEESRKILENLIGPSSPQKDNSEEEKKE